MPNNNVFRGSDAALILAVDDGFTFEGKLATDLLEEYSLSTIVGRLQQVSIKVENDVRPYHQIGNRLPSELRPGNIYISGSASRAHINGALIRLMLGDSVMMAQPTFNMVIHMLNPAFNTTKIILFGVKFDSWVFTLPEDDFVMESVTFQATRITNEEIVGSDEDKKVGF